MLEHEPTCPLCEFSGETTMSVYRHLQVSHRKSELSKALLQPEETEQSKLKVSQ